MDRELGPLMRSKLNCYIKFNKMVQTLIHCKQPQPTIRLMSGARKTFGTSAEYYFYTNLIYLLQQVIRNTDTEFQKKELHEVYEWFRINRLFLRPKPFPRMPRLSLSFTTTTCHRRAETAPSTLQANSTGSHRPGETRDMTNIKSTASSYMSRSLGNRMNLIGQPFDQLKVIPTTIKSANVRLQSTHAFPNLLLDHCMSKRNCPHLESPVYPHDLFSLTPQVAAQMVVDKDEVSLIKSKNYFDILHKLVKSMASPKQLRLCTTPLNTTMQIFSFNLMPSRYNINCSCPLHLTSPSHFSLPQHQIPVGMSKISSRSAKSYNQTCFADINTTQLAVGKANDKDEGNATGLSNTEKNKRSFSLYPQSSQKWTYRRVIHIGDAQKPRILLKATYPSEIVNPLSAPLATDAVKVAKKDLCNKDSAAQEHEHGKAPNVGHRTDSGGHVASEKAEELLMSFNLLTTHSLEQTEHYGQVSQATVVQTNNKSMPLSRAKSVPGSLSEKNAGQCNCGVVSILFPTGLDMHLQGPQNIIQCPSHPRKIPSAIAGFRKRRYCRTQTVPASMERKKTNIN